MFLIYLLQPFYEILFAVVPFLLWILLMLFCGRRNIKVFANTFDIVGINIIMPILFLFSLAPLISDAGEYASIINIIVYIPIGIFVFYIFYSLCVCIQYNFGCWHWILALFLRFYYFVLSPISFLLFLLGNSDRENSRGITFKNMSKFSLVDQFIFSVKNVVAIRKVFDKEKNIFVRKNTARSIYDDTESVDVKDNKAVDKNDAKI